MYLYVYDIFQYLWYFPVMHSATFSSSHSPYIIDSEKIIRKVEKKDGNFDVPQMFNHDYFNRDVSL